MQFFCYFFTNLEGRFRFHRSWSINYSLPVKKCNTVQSHVKSLNNPIHYFQSFRENFQTRELSTSRNSQIQFSRNISLQISLFCAKTSALMSTSINQPPSTLVHSYVLGAISISIIIFQAYPQESDLIDPNCSLAPRQKGRVVFLGGLGAQYSCSRYV